MIAAHLTVEMEGCALNDLKPPVSDIEDEGYVLDAVWNGAICNLNVHLERGHKRLALAIVGLLVVSGENNYREDGQILNNMCSFYGYRNGDHIDDRVGANVVHSNYYDYCPSE